MGTCCSLEMSNVLSNAKKDMVKRPAVTAADSAYTADTNREQYAKYAAFRLVRAYVLNAEKMMKLSMNVDKGIVDLIAAYFWIPLFRFNECHKSLTLSDDDFRICGTTGCSAYCAFTIKLENDGHSVYYWGLQNEDYVDCYRSVGVITDDQRSGWKDRTYSNWIRPRPDPLDYRDANYNDFHFDGFKQKWNKETIIVKLDYGQRTVSFYRKQKRIKTGKIDSKKSYYFALLLCSQKTNKMRIVDVNSDELKES